MNDASNRAPRLLVMAGGTGGHVFPGLAVAELLRHQGWQVHWLGTAERMEAQLVPRHGFPISFIEISGLRGNGWKRLLQAPWQIFNAVRQARQVIQEVQPDVVLGMGGYASGPGGIAARLSRKPLVLHEQNAVAGMTNRLLARIASQVLVAFPQALPGYKRRQVVGNPVRRQLFTLTEPRLRLNRPGRPLRVLVIGGSLGARVLNQTMPAAVELAMASVDLAVWHQCGRNNHEAVAAEYAALSKQPAELQVNEFIDDMVSAMSWADLVVCRAGALTVSELAAAGLGSILVPLPHAVDDHQTINARTLSDQGAAVLMPQSELSAQHLASEFVRLAGNRELLTEMALTARGLAQPEATAAVAQTCVQLARKTVK